MKIATLLALGVSVQGAASSIKNTDWPKFAVPSTSCGSCGMSSLNDLGYACIRNNYAWAWP